MLVCCVFKEFVDHCGPWGNVAQALAQWHHPVASSEAQDVRHWAIHPALHHCIRMGIKIPSI